MTQESSLSIADAVMILAWVHFMDERAYCREEVTEKAANKIAALTSAIGCMPVHPVAELGVHIRRGVVTHVPEAVLLHACALVLRQGLRPNRRNDLQLLEHRGEMAGDQLIREMRLPTGLGISLAR